MSQPHGSINCSPVVSWFRPVSTVSISAAQSSMPWSMRSMCHGRPCRRDRRTRGLPLSTGHADARAGKERLHPKSFAQLLGTIHCFCGKEAAHRAPLRRIDANEPWMDQQEPTDLLLIDAGCSVIQFYPVIAARGILPSEGGLYDMHSWCFRRGAVTRS